MYTLLPERLNVGLALLLTAAMYKLVIAGMLPEVSYLTLLDKYILYNCLVIIAFLVDTAIMALFESMDDYSDVGMYAVLGMWTLAQLMFMLRTIVWHRDQVDQEEEPKPMRTPGRILRNKTSQLGWLTRQLTKQRSLKADSSRQGNEQNVRL